MDEHRAGAEVHLGCIARLERQPAGGLRWQLGADVGQQPTHGRIAASPGVLALQGGMDGCARDALLNPSNELGPMRLQGGDGGAGAPGLAQSRGYGLVVGKWLLDIEPAARGRQLAPLPRLASTHEPCRRDLPVGLALAHA